MVGDTETLKLESDLSKVTDGKGNQGARLLVRASRPARPIPHGGFWGTGSNFPSPMGTSELKTETRVQNRAITPHYLSSRQDPK